MDATPAQPSLLHAARNFIRKSTGTAVLAIAPLAAVSVAPKADAQVAIFGGSALSGGQLYNPASGGRYFAVTTSGAFSIALSTVNNIQGTQFGASLIEYSSPYSTNTGLSATSYFYSIGEGTGTLADGVTLPTSYKFDIETTAGVTNLSWYIHAELVDNFSSTYPFVIGSGSIATGGGTVNFTGNTTPVFTISEGSITLGATSYNVTFNLSYDAATSADLVRIHMNQAGGQGIFLNATVVPEPGTYALLFGLMAIGGVALRRFRRNA